MTITGNKLKPCPFCGCEFINVMKIKEDGFRDTSGYFLECPECEIETPIYDTLEEAIEKWNRRTGS